MESVKTGTHWHWNSLAEGGPPKWHPPLLFLPEKFPADPCSFGTHAEISRYPLYMVQALFTRLPLWWVLKWVRSYAVWSLGFLLACSSPGVKPCWFFNAPGFTPCWFSKPDVIGTCLPSADSQGKGRSMLGMVLEPQHSLGPPYLCYPSCLWVAVPEFVSWPDCISASPILLDVPVSLYLYLWKNCSASLQVILGGGCSPLVAALCVHGKRWAQDLPTPFSLLHPD